MIRWWRTGWAPIQRALNEQRRRDVRRLCGWVWRDGAWHLPRLDIPTAPDVSVIIGVHQFLRDHPETMEALDAEMERRGLGHPITDRDVREATIAGYRKIRKDPRSLRLTSGQRDHIVNRKRR